MTISAWNYVEQASRAGGREVFFFPGSGACSRYVFYIDGVRPCCYPAAVVVVRAGEAGWETGRRAYLFALVVYEVL